MGAKYGQHFLINKHAIDRIVEALELTSSDSVLEIGPGKGALTAALMAKAPVSAVEVDPDMIQLLKSRFGSNPRFQLFPGDILEFNFSKLGTASYKVAGNLPYNLTSPILRRLSEWTGWTTALVMVQKEVGDRMCATHATSDYGALTVGMNLTCQMEPVFELSESSFNPPPKVRSAVVKLIRREKPLTENVERAQRVIQAAFQQRRKTILNSLSHGLEMDKEPVEKILESLKIDPGVRPERIPVAKFVELSEALFRN